MRVVGAEIREDHALAATAAGVEVVGVATLLGLSDVVSLNCPLTHDNWHMIDETALAAMKAGAFVINTARGALIDESALVAALQRGHLGGAALDVFEEEPLPAESQLRTLDRVILGTHNSSNTAEAVQRTSVQAIDNLLDGLKEAGR
jgi:D-3-phosphoglycerate dehydrogenase